MEAVAKVVGVVVIAVVAIIALGFLLSWPIYMLWNGCLIGAVDGVHEITWLQAWGLNVLFGLLFKTNVTK
jgi:hypothetical protein